MKTPGVSVSELGGKTIVIAPVQAHPKLCREHSKSPWRLLGILLRDFDGAGATKPAKRAVSEKQDQNIYLTLSNGGGEYLVLFLQFFFYPFICVRDGSLLRASRVLGNCSTTDLRSQPLLIFIIKSQTRTMLFHGRRWHP